MADKTVTFELWVLTTTINWNLYTTPGTISYSFLN